MECINIKNSLKKLKTSPSGTGNGFLMLLPVLPSEVFNFFNEFLILIHSILTHISEAHMIFLNLFSHFFTKQYYISSLLACMMLYKVMNVVSLSSFKSSLAPMFVMLL